MKDFSKYTLSEFPVAVCYRIDELHSFIYEAIQMFDRKNIPEAERGVGVMLGTSVATGGHIGNKVTLMLVATRWVEAPGDKGKVLSISNPIIHAGWPGQPPEGIKGGDPDADVAYDAGSLWP